MFDFGNTPGGDTPGSDTSHTHTPTPPIKRNVVEATCKTEGSYDDVVYCATCNEEISRTTKTTEKTNVHIPAESVRENVVEATCKTTGSYDEVVYCSICDTEISRTTVTLTDGAHSFGEWKIDKLYCTGVNQRYRTCTQCSFTEYSKIAAPGHIFEDGKCKLCGLADELIITPVHSKLYLNNALYESYEALLAVIGEKISEYPEFSKYDSEYFEDNILITASIMRMWGPINVVVYTSVDGYVFNAKIAPPKPTSSEPEIGFPAVTYANLLIEIPRNAYSGCNIIDLWDGERLIAEFVIDGICEHTETFTAIEEPTCTKVGYEKKICLKCGITVEETELSATGHTYGDWHKIPANGCASIDYSVRFCLVCGAADYDIDKVGVTHPHDFDHTYVAPTCTEPGRVRIVCKNCGIVGADEILAPLGHNMNWVLTETTHSRECVRAGCDYATAPETHFGEPSSPCDDTRCSFCGYIMKEGVGHSFSLEYTTDAFSHWRECTREGCDAVCNFGSHICSDAKCTDTSAVCDVCRATYVPSAAHTYGAWSIVSQASCSRTGTERRDCIYCDKFETRTISTLPHEMGAWYYVSEPTETESGLMRRDCKNCDYYETKQLQAKGHQLGKWYVIKNATCTESGIAEAKCQNCDYTYQKTISAYGHTCRNWRTDKASTCTESGLSYGYCTRCGEYLTRTEKPLGHSYGVYYYNSECHWRVCTRCGVSTEREAHHGGKTTCTSYARCSDCGSYYGNAPTGHRFGTSLSYNDSYHYYACLNSGCSAKDRSERHTIVASTETLTVEDTGTQIRYKHTLYYTCTKCSYTRAVSTVNSEHYGCKVLEGREPTCTKDGLTWGYACAVPGCSDVYLAQETISALGHNYVGGVCTRCGDRENGGDTPGGDNPGGDTPGGDNPGAHTHTPAPAVIENRVDGNCTVGGSYYEVVYCATCSEELSRVRRTTSPNGMHVSGSPVSENKVEPTCNKEGSYERVVYCSLCGKELSRTTVAINKNSNHTPAAAVREKYVPATCKKGGSYEEVVYCSVCGEEISRTPKAITAQGHNYENGECTRCGCLEIYSEGLIYTSTGSDTCSVSGIGTCTDKDIVIPPISKSQFSRVVVVYGRR